MPACLATLGPTTDKCAATGDAVDGRGRRQQISRTPVRWRENPGNDTRNATTAQRRCDGTSNSAQTARQISLTSTPAASASSTVAAESGQPVVPGQAVRVGVAEARLHPLPEIGKSHDTQPRHLPRSAAWPEPTSGTRCKCSPAPGCGWSRSPSNMPPGYLAAAGQRPGRRGDVSVDGAAPRRPTSSRRASRSSPRWARAPAGSDSPTPRSTSRPAPSSGRPRSTTWTRRCAPSPSGTPGWAGGGGGPATTPSPSC